MCVCVCVCISICHPQFSELVVVSKPRQFTGQKKILKLKCTKVGIVFEVWSFSQPVCVWYLCFPFNFGDSTAKNKANFGQSGKLPLVIHLGKVWQRH